MNVLILLGSLRADSTNRRLAEAAIAHLPAGAHAHISTLPAALPFYDEDLDIPGAAPSAVAAADALIVVPPEYNGTVSGVLGNAIDWASRPRGDAAITGKPALVLAPTGAVPSGPETRRFGVSTSPEPRRSRASGRDPEPPTTQTAHL